MTGLADSSLTTPAGEIAPNSVPGGSARTSTSAWSKIGNPFKESFPEPMLLRHEPDGLDVKSWKSLLPSWRI